MGASDGGSDGDWISAIAIDPGTHTGVAWARVKRPRVRALGVGRAIGEVLAGPDGSRDGVKLGREMLSRRGEAGWKEFGPATSQRKELEMAREVVQHCEGLVAFWGGVDAIACEDFVRRPHMKSSDPRVLSPVRLAAHIAGGLAFGVDGGEPLGVALDMQPPSTMGVVTDARLKLWNLWVPGRPHARDALRHLVVRMRKLVE